ncbi:MAG: hypothetical protein M3Y17_14835 [Actinomycetota bacterium]|nr:hypothetical protein [Actinomycetota bacterium]
MESEERDPGQQPEEQDMPHGHEGSDREGGQVGVGVGGLGGAEPGGTQSDQGRGYGAEGGSARDLQEDMPHGHEGSDREGPQVGVGTGGLGGQEWSGRREESSGQGDEPDTDSDEG